MLVRYFVPVILLFTPQAFDLPRHVRDESDDSGTQLQFIASNRTGQAGD